MCFLQVPTELDEVDEKGKQKKISEKKVKTPTWAFISSQHSR